MDLHLDLSLGCILSKFTCDALQIWMHFLSELYLWLLTSPRKHVFSTAPIVLVQGLDFNLQGGSCINGSFSKRMPAQKPVKKSVNNLSVVANVCLR